MININHRSINQPRALPTRNPNTQIRNLIDITQRRPSSIHKLRHLLIPLLVDTSVEGIADVRLHCAHDERVAADTFVGVEGGCVFGQADEAVFAGCVGGTCAS